jgi:hypothetical protein
MAKLLSICVAGVLVVLAILTSSAGATHNPGNGPPFDFVKGSGQLPFVTPFGVLDVSIAVDGRSDGVNVSGEYSATIRGIINVEISGHLTCLRTDGAEVVISGVVEQTNNPIAPLGSGVIAMGIDNGRPDKQNGSPVDTVLALPQGRPLTTCPRAISAGVQLTSGDFVAHDGFKTQAG